MRTMLYKIPVKMAVIAALLTGCKGEKEQMDVNSRERTIQELLLKTRAEHDSWLKQGVDDGNGLLYQATPSYQRLQGFCTERELIEIHEKINSALPYRKIEMQ